MYKKVDKEQINVWIERAYENAKKHGWHEEKKSDGHWLMMIGTEIAEAVQADRKGRWFDELTKSGLECVLANDHHDDLVEKFYEDNIEGTVESELADICIRVFDFMGVKRYKASNGIVLKEDNLNLIKKDSFTENAFKCANIIFDDFCMNKERQQFYIEILLDFLFGWAEVLNINLQQQIELKMRYNESREYHHGGKKY